jgi:hypothetical protein
MTTYKNDNKKLNADKNEIKMELKEKQNRKNSPGKLYHSKIGVYLLII